MSKQIVENESRVEEASTTEGLPVDPSLGPTLASAQVPAQRRAADGRVVALSGLAVALGVAAAAVALGLTRLIGLVTNIAFFGRVSSAFVSPAGNHLGLWVIAVPVVGGLVVGAMARYGSHAIRGHGIPEAMQQVLTNQSRIPARVTLLKPLSAAIAIGTGGPFGAEGPIIATGGALGSLLGQALRTTASERKTLLAAGAAAGMAATFGTPVAALLLAIELLLFELRPRSLIPVALAAAAATAVRFSWVSAAPVFEMKAIAQPSSLALVTYTLFGLALGFAGVWITGLVYAIEDAFERLPIHWMWWPAIGAVAVGGVGYLAPRTLGVGYDNITGILTGDIAGRAVATLCLLKLVSWSISLGSGTSGGTLAPLFTIGGALGAVLGSGTAALWPTLGVDPQLAALVGMAAVFAAASRSVLASVVFAFEMTRQPLGLLPLVGGCTSAYLISCLFMRNTLMTEKIIRRGVRVPGELTADFLEMIPVKEQAHTNVVTLLASQSLAQVRSWLAQGTTETSHQGFPVLDDTGRLVGVVTRRDLLNLDRPGQILLREVIHRAPVVIFEDSSLREAADQMVREEVGRLPVVDRQRPGTLVGFITRSDILAAHAQRLREHHVAERSVSVRLPRRRAKREPERVGGAPEPPQDG